MNLAAVLAACRHEPEDDEPRLVWSDAIGGPRGELVAVQCALARGETSLERARELREREAALLRAHGSEWSGLAGIAKRCTFRRGFVDSVVMSPRTGPLADVLSRAPLLTSLVIERTTAEALDGFFADDDWRAFAAIGFLADRSAWDGLSILDRLAREDLEHLRGLEVLTGAPDPSNLPLLEQVVHLRLWHPVGRLNGVVKPWVSRMKQLRALHVQHLQHDDAALPSTLVELGAGFVDARDHAMLPAQLERLRLFGPLDGFEVVERLPLRSLDLSRAQLGPGATTEAFARLPWPELRELAWTTHGTPPLAIAERFRDQLHSFDAGASEYPPALRVGGYLVPEADHYAWFASGFLTPRVDLTEPWLNQLAVLL
ncbi:MAG TPA: hypothetical protein VGC41_24750 [Kofleriaceae bacterium]